MKYFFTGVNVNDAALTVRLCSASLVQVDVEVKGRCRSLVRDRMSGAASKAEHSALATATCRALINGTNRRWDQPVSGNEER